MNKKTDKLIDALDTLNEEQIASCMKPRRKKAFLASGKARIALVLAAALLITTLASALIVAPMMLGEDIPGEIPGETTDAQSTAPSPESTDVPPVENVMTYPGIAQLLSLGNISYSGFTVSDDGLISMPGQNSGVSFDETDEYFTAPMPIITLNCGAENTVKLSCDYGALGQVKQVREYGEMMYQYVDDNGGKWNLFYLSHFADSELTLKGDEKLRRKRQRS